MKNNDKHESGNKPIVRPENSKSDDSSADELPGFDPSSEQPVQQQRVRKDPLIGQTLGRYKILQELGKGGMGTVYMADQERPIRRRVALKVIKEKKDSEQVLLRFEAERQALAMMNHENIAKVLDAGEDQERPYFAMELVKGIPITQYCDTNRLDVKGRLDLFVSVCNAINHAHQKGIIHRDLKPSNILVEEVNGTPVPKVIDFGLAKALNTQAKLTDETFFTEFGRVVGTVHYMSPEQAEMNQLDVDTRTDIYSLGVILYELLTGTRPLDDETIKQNVFLRILELIREQEPDKPSSRVSESKHSEIDFGKQRRLSTSKLQQTLRGDLDWIVMKSLEKDRSRRYASASDFGNDVKNYLNGDAVNARKPTIAYKLSKFTRKNATAVITTGVIMAVVVVGFVVSSVLAVNLNDAVKQKETALGLANDKTLEAEQKAEELSKQKEKLSQLSNELRYQKEETEQAKKETETQSREWRTLFDSFQSQDVFVKALPFKSLGKLFETVGLKRIATLFNYQAQSIEGSHSDTAATSPQVLTVKRQSSRRLWQKEMAISDSGAWLSTADLVTGRIRIWNSKTKKLVSSWDAHYIPSVRGRGGFWPTVSGMDFDPSDESVLFSSGLDGSVVKWDHVAQKRLAEFNSQNSQITTLVFDKSSEIRTLVVGTNQGELIRLDAKELKELARKKIADQRLNQIAVNKDGLLVVAGQEGTLLICGPEFQTNHTVDEGLPDLLCVSFSPDGKVIAVGDTAGNISQFMAEGLELQKTIAAHGKGQHATDDLKKVRTLCWTEQGVFSGGSDGSIKKWGKDFELETEYKGHGPNVYGRDDIMAVAANGTECFSIGRDHTTRVWDIGTGKCTHSLQGSLFPHQQFHQSDYTRFSYHAPTKQLLTATDAKDAYARLWDIDNLREVKNYKSFPISRYIDENGGPQTQDIAFSNDGKRFAVAEPTGQISVWSIDSEKPRSFPAHSLTISGNPRKQYMRLSWSRDDQQLISIGNDHKLKIWNTIDYSLTREFSLIDPNSSIDDSQLPEELAKELVERTLRLEFDHQLLLKNELIITAGRDNFVRIWNSEDSKLDERINVGSTVTCLTASGDMSYLAVGTNTGMLALIDLEQKKLIGSHNLDHSAIDEFAFGARSPLNNRNWFGENEFKVWNRSILGIAFSPNGRLLAVSTGNGVLSIVKSTGEVLHRAFNYDAFARSWRQQFPIFTSDGRLFTVGADQSIREWDLHHNRAEAIGDPQDSVVQVVADAKSDRMIQIGLPEKADDFVWENANGKWNAIRLPAQFKDITSATFIPNSDEILLGTLYGRAIRFDYRNEKVKIEFNGKDGKRVFKSEIGAYRDGSRVACSYNGGLAASTWSEKGQHTIDIWDLESGKWVANIPTLRGVEAMTFHPQLKMLAITNELGELRLMDLELESEPVEMFRSKGPQFARGLQFSPNAQMLVQAGEYYNNRLMCIWNPANGNEIDPVTGMDASSLSIRIAGHDLFDVESIISVNGKRKVAYRDLAISPNGKWMATAGKDGFLVLWQIDGTKVTIKHKIPFNNLRTLMGDLTEPGVILNFSMEHTGLENVEFSSSSETIYCALKQGPVLSVRVSELIRLADRPISEKLSDYKELIGLTIEGDARAVNIERNQLEPLID